jgi:hypothetical protein
MPKLTPPPDFYTWPAAKQQRWTRDMNALAAEQEAYSQPRKAVTPTVRPKVAKPAVPATRAKAAPAKAQGPRAPSLPGTLKAIKDRNKYLQGLRHGGLAKKR